MAHTSYESLSDDFCASAIVSYPVRTSRENQPPFYFSTIIPHCRLILPRRTLWQNYPKLVSKGERRDTFDVRTISLVLCLLQVIQSWRTRYRGGSMCCKDVNISRRFVPWESDMQNAAALPIDPIVISSSTGQQCDPKSKHMIKMGGCGIAHV